MDTSFTNTTTQRAGNVLPTTTTAQLAAQRIHCFGKLLKAANPGLVAHGERAGTTTYHAQGEDSGIHSLDTNHGEANDVDGTSVSSDTMSALSSTLISIQASSSNIAEELVQDVARVYSPHERIAAEGRLDLWERTPRERLWHSDSINGYQRTATDDSDKVSKESEDQTNVPEDTSDAQEAACNPPIPAEMEGSDNEMARTFLLPGHQPQTTSSGGDYN